MATSYLGWGLLLLLAAMTPRDKAPLPLPLGRLLFSICGASSPNLDRAIGFLALRAFSYSVHTYMRTPMLLLLLLLSRHPFSNITCESHQRHTGRVGAIGMQTGPPAKLAATVLISPPSWCLPA